MKNLGFIAVVALLMILGCSKDEMITTEQESISVKEINQPVIYGEKGPAKGNAGVGGIRFFSTSIITDSFILEWTQKKDEPGPPLQLDRKLLMEGTFSGKLAGYGKINSSLSWYTFSSCDPADIDSPPNGGEPLMYKFTAEGEIYLSTRDYCSITITGNLYPWYYTDIEFDGGQVIGTATTYDGFGKLKKLNKTFWIWRSGMDRYGINLTTGEISFDIME